MTDQFLIELVSLVQSQDEVIRILALTLDNEAGIGDSLGDRIDALHERVLDVQSEAMRMNAERQTDGEKQD